MDGHDGGACAGVCTPRHPTQCAGQEWGEESESVLTFPLLAQGLFLMSSDPASPFSPHVGTGTALISPGGGGRSHSWQSLNTLLGAGMVEILIARSQWPWRHSLPGRGTVTSTGHGDKEDRSGGHLGKAPASVHDR